MLNGCHGSHFLIVLLNLQASASAGTKEKAFFGICSFKRDRYRFGRFKRASSERVNWA